MQNDDSPKVTHLSVDADSDGQRIDNYLKKYLSGVPVGHVYRIIRTGQVRVNGKRIKASGRLAAGDDLRLPPMFDMEADRVVVPESVVSRLEAAVIFENEELLVLNKPGGLAVHGGSGLAFGIIEALRQSRDNGRLELVHRLDRETSGCLLIGKTLISIRKYQDIFRERRVLKQYRALVHGQWQADEERVSNHLSSNREISGERMVVADDGGKFAESFFSTRRKFTTATEMDVRITTGRTHQIRVHARSCGHPLVGDSKYGDKVANKQFRKNGFKRLFLHAERLELENSHKFEAQPDDSWNSSIQALADA